MTKKDARNKKRFSQFQKRLFETEIQEEPDAPPAKLEHPTLEPPTLLQVLSVQEIYDQANQDLLEQLQEDRRVERKLHGIHAEELLEYVVMWANTPPDGGLLVIGQSDNGDWQGCRKLSQKTINRFEYPNEHCQEATCDSKRVEVILPDGSQDFIVLIHVHHVRRRRVVRTPKGKVFTRRSDKKKELTDDEIRNLQIDIGEVDFEQEPCGLDYPKQFDTAAIRTFCEILRTTLELTGDVSDEELLRCRHLGETKGGNFIPNYACALLFASEPDRLMPGCKIRFFRFEGKKEGSGERFNAVKDIWIEGLTVPKLIEKAQEVLESQIRTFSALGDDGRFYTQQEYPKSAWYEAVVNACVHRAYGNGLRKMMITIKMFDDRLEIDSPGGFLPFINPENIYGHSCPRNPKLMEAMYFMKVVKMAAEGTRRMRDTMEEAGLPRPEFSQREQMDLGCTRVRVTLKNDIEHRSKWVDKDAAAIVGAAIAKTLTDNDKRVLNFIAEHGAINVTQAVRLTGLDWGTAKKRLMSLAVRGILHREANPKLERDPNAKFMFPKDLE